MVLNRWNFMVVGYFLFNACYAQMQPKLIDKDSGVRKSLDSIAEERIIKQCACQDTSSPTFDLYSDAEQSILSHVDSLLGLTVCARVCKRWSMLLSQHVVNMSLFHSPQDFLQHVVEGSLETVKMKKSSLVGMLQESPFQSDMCSVVERFWIQTALVLGEESLLKGWLQRIKESKDVGVYWDAIQTLIDLILSLRFYYYYNETTLKMDHDRLHHLVKWLLQLIHIDQPSTMIQSLQTRLFYWAVLNGDKDIAMDASLASVRTKMLSHTVAQTEMLGFAAESPVKQYCTDYLVTPISNLQQPVSHWFMIEQAIGHCRLCDAYDIQRMLHALDPPARQHSLEEILQYACQKGNLNLVRVLFEYFGLRFSHYPHLVFAIRSGRLELIQWMLAQNTELQLTGQLLLTSIPSNCVMSLAVLNHFIPLLPLSPRLASDFIRLYAARGCGNDRDMQTIKTLSQVPGLQVDPEWLSFAIHRPDFREYPDHMYNNIYIRTQMCPKNESMQLIKFFVDELHIVPDDYHLNLAFKRGRLDIVKFIYEKGNDLVVDGDSFSSMLATRHLGKIPSYQEPDVLDFAVEKFLLRWPEHERTANERKLWRILHQKMEPNKKNLDCFFARVARRVSV